MTVAQLRVLLAAVPDSARVLWFDGETSDCWDARVEVSFAEPAGESFRKVAKSGPESLVAVVVS